MLLTILLAIAQQTPGNVAGPRFEVSFPARHSAKPLDGRLLVLISNDSTDEPRNQISDGLNTQLISTASRVAR